MSSVSTEHPQRSQKTHDVSRHSGRVAINAFELLARSRVDLSLRVEASFGALTHLVHQHGRAFAWGVSDKFSMSPLPGRGGPRRRAVINDVPLAV